MTHEWNPLRSLLLVSNYSGKEKKKKIFQGFTRTATTYTDRLPRAGSNAERPVAGFMYASLFMHMNI